MDHECQKEEKFQEIDKNLKRIEGEVKGEAIKHEELRKTINSKLDKIRDLIEAGDNRNTKNMFLIVGMFVGAIMSILAICIALIK